MVAFAAGNAPAGLEVSEPIFIRGENGLTLPEGLTVSSITIRGGDLKALPNGLTARRIDIQSGSLIQIGAGTKCRSLQVNATPLEALPDDLVAGQRVDLVECHRLKTLPAGLQTGSLNVSECVALTALPENLEVAFLETTGCSSLRRLPEGLRINGGHLILRNCSWLTTLPENIGSVAGLDVSGCLNLTRIPDSLEVTSWIDFANSGIRELSDRFDDVGLRWHGIPVSRRIVFEAESFTPAEILGERNAELRRVMMERFGYDRLFEAASAVELDRDEDAGGERRLMRIPLEDDEDLVCVFVQCPSTGHKFALRVPPDMTTCHQAVAWTAGYDDPALYKPSMET